jgi:hypothetical protein
MTIKGFIANLKCIKFYQVTYFDATPLMYNHQNRKMYTSHKND